MDDKPLTWKGFWSYVGYGLAACVFLVIPLVAIHWLHENLPGLAAFIEWLSELDAPWVGIVIGIAISILVLAVMGWVLRGMLWEKLRTAPIIGTLMSSTENLSKGMAGLDRSSRKLVAWVQFARYRNLGVVMSRNRDPDGTEYATVYVLSGAAHFRGNLLSNVKVSDLVFPAGRSTRRSCSVRPAARRFPTGRGRDLLRNRRGHEAR